MAAQERDGPGGAHDAIELIAVDYQKPLAVGLAVNDAVDDLDVAEGHAVVVPEHLVVIPRHVDHLGAVLGLAEDRSKNIIVVLGPERPLSHRPYVDDVTDEVEKFAFHRTKESQQGRSAAAAESQVDVGKPDRAIDLRSRSRGIQHVVTSMSRTTLGELQGKLRCLKTGPSTSLRYACPEPFGKGKVSVCFHDDAVASETGSVR